MMKYVIIVLVILNFISFALYGIDKHKAKKNRWRISEKTLIIWSMAAPFGAICGSKTFHHKTKKTKFDIVMFVACIVHLIIYGTVISMMTK